MSQCLRFCVKTYDVASQLELLRLVRIKEQDIDCPVKHLFVPQVPEDLYDKLMVMTGWTLLREYMMHV
jgi:hypothetical protein